MHSRATPEVSPTVLDTLRASPVGPVLELPLPQAAASNPIDALLQSIPVPALPDIDQLLRPLSDLGSMFGTGIVDALDPAGILQQSSRLLDTATTLGRSALDALPDSWAGESAEAAAEHGRRARAAAGELSERGDLIGEITRAATAAVERGNLELTSIAQSFVTVAAATAPVAMTPPGQAALVAAAVEHVQVGLAVVARTRGELAGHTASMYALTAPIPVPAPVAGAGAGATLPDPGAVASATSDVASTVVSSITGSQGAVPTVPPAHTAGSAASVPAATTPAALAAGDSPGGNLSGGGVFGSGVAGGAVGVGAAGAPAVASGAPTATSAPPAAPAAGGSRGPMLGGAPLGGAARSDDDRRSPPGFLVNPTNTTDVVGDLPMVTPPVIGNHDDDL